MPEVRSDGDLIATGLYAASDPFPEDLQPGEAVSGWVRLGGDHQRLASAGRLNFLFRDVAADRYHDVGDLAVTAAAP
jgi:hypothetical protein